MILFVGDVGIDEYHVGEQIEYFWGGCSLNAWLSAHEISKESMLWSARSRDYLLPGVLESVSLDWPSSKLPPPTQVITIDHLGERHLGRYTSNSLNELALERKLLELIAKAGIVAMPLYEQTRTLCVSILDALPGGNRKVALDVGTMIDFNCDLSFLIPYLDRIYLIQSSEKEVTGLCDADIIKVETHGANPVIVRRGNESRRYEVLSEAKNVLDSTGAGDFFFGKVLAALQAHDDIDQAIITASAATVRILEILAPNLLAAKIEY